MSDNYEQSGLRAQGENDRSFEFISERDHLVETVNTWLQSLAVRRDQQEPLADGSFITDRSRIVRSILGKTAFGNNAMAEEFRRGVSLNGDGITSPLVLQSVRQSETGQARETIEARGSDPLARQLADNTYSTTGAREKVASFMLTETDSSGDESYFGYEVNGDGSVAKKYLDSRGYHTTKTINSVDEIQLATQAFATVQSQFDNRPL